MLKPAKVLIVDDNETNREVLKHFIIDLGHEPLLAENGLSAFDEMTKELPDLVLLDILMPEMNGYEVLARMKIEKIFSHIPVIIISALDDLDAIAKCISRGADDYLTKPFNPVLLEARIKACLDKKRMHDLEQKDSLKIEELIRNLNERVIQQVHKISSAQQGTIFAMAKLAKSRDPESGEHLPRVSEYCKVISEKLRLLSKYKQVIDSSFVDDIFVVSPLHDIGKVGIPDRILQKPGKLTDEEFSMIKTHSIIGAETLREVDQQYPGNSFVLMGIEICESHHEKWDGSGYPNGLKGDEIPLVGRILALGDVYDALTSKRYYKEAFSYSKSREIVIKESGKHFDPEIVDTFISVEKEFIEIRELFLET